MTAAVIDAALFFVISLHLRTRQRTHFHAPTIQTNSFCFGEILITKILKDACGDHPQARKKKHVIKDGKDRRILIV